MAEYTTKDMDFISLLLKVDKRLDNIENQLEVLHQQNDRKCRTSEGKKDCGLSTRASSENTSYRRDNFVNQMSADIARINVDTIGRKDRSGSKVSKSASFTEKSPTKYKASSKRFPHTVPSDKDESKRIDSFRRECLSKAIQWHMVEFIKALTDDQNIVLPKWLNKTQAREILESTTKKDQLRIFLCILKGENFATMQEWLNCCNLDRNVVCLIWKTYEEFSDSRTNKIDMKCFRCRLSENVHINKVIDYLISGDIISEATYRKAIKSELPVGAQKELWDIITNECKDHSTPDNAVSALKIALTDANEEALGIDKLVLERLVDDIDTHQDCPDELFQCYCSVLCSKSLHPISCLKSMTLTDVYMSPPTRRKSTEVAEPKRRKSTAAADDPSSVSSSSRSTLTSVGSSSSSEHSTNRSPYDGEDDSVPEDETHLKSVCGEMDNEQNMIYPSVTQKRRSVRTSRPGRNRRMGEVAEAGALTSSSSSQESVDGLARKTQVAAREEHKYQIYSENNKTFENKPNVVYAKTVNINSQFYHLPRSNKNVNGSSSSDSSSYVV